MKPKRHQWFFALGLLAACFSIPTAVTAQDRPGPRPKAVAAIDGKEISETELNQAAASELEKLEMQKLQFEAEYVHNRQRALESALAHLIEERLLDEQASRLGITKQELVAREVEAKVQAPSQEEIDQFYESNRDRIRAPKEQILPQISQYLRQQNLNKAKQHYLDVLKKDRKVTLSLAPLRQDVSLAGHPTKGKVPAPVTIVEFSDFQCPYCREFTATLERVMKEFPSEVRLVFRQLPLVDIHPMAEKAAEAALCALDQGKFWELHDLMFKDQTSLKVEDLKAKALGLGLDAAAFNSCLDSGKQTQRVRDDMRDGARLGAGGTPAIFINGRFFSGARPFEDIALIINEELESARPPSARP
jgi:protein-disulfide isomerase